MNSREVQQSQLPVGTFIQFNLIHPKSLSLHMELSNLSHSYDIFCFHWILIASHCLDAADSAQQFRQISKEFTCNHMTPLTTAFVLFTYANVIR